VIEEKIESLPCAPGVYIFKDHEGRPIYIGKAKNLKERVRSYFREERKGLKTEALVRAADDLDFFIVRNEKEAFLLENNLIKAHRPRYNIVLKDDKTYISLKLTVKETFPALFITRKVKDDGSLYFGPYPRAKDTRDVLRLLQTLYPIRRCKLTQFKKRKRACILSEMGRCMAPCESKVSEKEYREVVSELIEFLSGKGEDILRRLEGQIEACASAWDFERADVLKRRYLAIKQMLERQKVHEHFGGDRDIFAFDAQRGRVRVAVLSFRKGILLHKRTFNERLHGELSEAIPTFLFQYYDGRPVPEEIILSEEAEDVDLLREHLADRRGRAPKILGPGSRKAQEFISLAIENLYGGDESLEEAFKAALRLRRVPKRIEVYDISHTFGDYPYGAMVVFEEFRKKKEDYRLFQIREAPSLDDPAMIGEVLRRRLSDEKLGPFPDLILIDGGKGQVGVAYRVLREMEKEIDVVGIAKGRSRRAFEEALFLPLRKNPLFLPKSSPVFRTILKMRDEAHRFALSSHRRRLRQIERAGKRSSGEPLPSLTRGS